MFVTPPVGCSVLQPVPPILRLGGTSLTQVPNVCIFLLPVHGNVRTFCFYPVQVLCNVLTCVESLQYKEEVRMDKYSLFDVLGGSTDFRLAECSLPCVPSYV